MSSAQDPAYERGVREALALIAERIANAAERRPEAQAITLGAVRLVLEGVVAELGGDGDAPAAARIQPENAQNSPAVPPPTLHRPERRGSDSEGYGQCTGCGDLWPCAGYRGEASA